MSQEWDEYASDWDSNEDVIAYSEKAFKTLLDAVDIKHMRVLDFGCGTGLLTERMSPLVKEIVALDSSKQMINRLVKKKLANVITVSEQLSESLIRESELFAEKFDLIVASSVCSFLPEYEKTLSLLKSLLVDGGIFIQWDWLSEESGCGFGLSLEQVENAYKNTGLKLQTLKQVFYMESSEGEIPVLFGVAKNA